MTIFVISDTPCEQPDPTIVRCPTCQSLDCKVSSSKPASEARMLYLQCQACQRTWKVRGEATRALVLLNIA